MMMTKIHNGRAAALKFRLKSNRVAVFLFLACVALFSWAFVLRSAGAAQMLQNFAGAD
eukprot:SAG11_NODE_33492_length_277_cov_0.578652_1_plen_57_part_10